MTDVSGLGELVDTTGAKPDVSGASKMTIVDYDDSDGSEKQGSESAINTFTDEQEDGEIVDDVDIKADLPEYMPLSGARKVLDDGPTDYNDGDAPSDDDEAPEEVLNRIAKMKAEIAETVEEELDPKLCGVCKKEPHKYRCPKCSVRSCSLACSKLHKESDQCDGVRGPFTNVAKQSQYDAQKSIEDQKFMYNVVNKVYQQQKPHVPSSNNQNTANTIPISGELDSNVTVDLSQQQLTPSEEGQMSQETDGPPQPFVYEQRINEDGTRNSASSAQERFLLPNAGHRRVWLSFTDDKGGDDCSRHEQYSDTIFWCLDLVFTKQLEDGSASEYVYRVQNIPETIRLCTVLKQFLKPRKYGCIVSESDLDMDKMAPFVEAGIEKINVFMRVPRLEMERYYVVNPERSILDNVRNRVIVNHPRLMITLDNEFMGIQSLSEFEGEELRSRMQKERSAQNRQSAANRGFRGGNGGGRGMRGGRGGFGDGGRGRGRGGRGFGHFDARGGGYQSRGRGAFQNKRPWGGVEEDAGGQSNYHGGSGGYQKRGRGQHSGGRGRYNNQRTMDDFDPFEPFEGPVQLPLEDWGVGRMSSRVKTEQIDAAPGENTA